jgi:hypothetical protein
VGAYISKRLPAVGDRFTLRSPGPAAATPSRNRSPDNI